MKKKRILINIVMLVLIGLAITSASLAWYPTVFSAAKSLDYVTFSETIVSFEADDTDFIAKVHPAEAIPGAVSLGKQIGNVFSLHDVDKGVITNVQKKATIAVSELNLAYYGQESESVAMKIECGATSTLADGTSINLSNDLSYIICAKGYGISSVGDKWLIDPTKIPDTDYWKETTNGTYVEYTKGYIMNPNDKYYLLDTNASHEDLWANFGVDNYTKVCEYNPNETEPWNFFVDEQYYNTDSFKEQVQKANGNQGQFEYIDAITYFWTKNNNGITTVSKKESIGTIAVSEEMNLNFLVLLWYNKVDELLDPAMSLGEIKITITVKIE